ncbi:MAG: hypothetical protein KY468_07560 [Armatimonadetes bacterium]|nr:hypothetical protein [Armatimonadota bacterium]
MPEEKTAATEGHDQNSLNRPDSGPGPSETPEEEAGRGPGATPTSNDQAPEEGATRNPGPVGP